MTVSNEWILNYSLLVYIIDIIEVASWRRGRVSDLRPEVVGSSLGRALRRKNSGQVSHTYVPLSLTKQYILVPAKAGE